MHSLQIPRFRSTFFVVLFLVIAADQLVKEWALVYLQSLGNMTIIPGCFSLTFVENTGVAFGLMQGHGWIVALLISVFAAVAVGLTGGIDWRRAEVNVVAGLLVGGALSNFLDRVRLGYVVDLLDAYIGMYHWPVFNLADSAICVAVSWIILRQVLTHAPG